MSNPETDLHERVLAQLGPAIVAGDTRPGDVLRIEELEHHFRVSRTVIREVVRVLDSMNLVSTRRRVGVTVRPPAEWNVFDPRVIRWRLSGTDRIGQLRSLSQLRAGVEPIAAGLAAEHARPEHCGALTAAIVGLSVSGKRGDLEGYVHHDIDFHRTLLSASGNEMFASLGDVVAEVLTGRAKYRLMPEPPEAEAIRLHIVVADAIQSGNRRVAEEAMRTIVAKADTILETMSPGGSVSDPHAPDAASEPTRQAESPVDAPSTPTRVRADRP
ncbi:MAG TPA: FCD domain-containing protein [Trebonia sp.]|jgi:DNA-binding FadR family transcriptional regulator|nr:FCD domain-containing protein [Trebonia sp.]